MKNLVDSLDEMNLPTGVDGKNPLIPVKVKPSFKKTKVYKEGNIYYNNVVDIPDSFYEDLSKYGVDNSSDITINWINVTKEFDYAEGLEEDSSTKLHDIEIKYDRRYWYKAFSRNSFYHFSRLKKYMPQLSSMEEFVEERWLNVKNGRRLFVRVGEGIEKKDLRPKDKLGIIKAYLKEVESQIKLGYQGKRGTSEFIGYPIKEYISDYRKRVPNYSLKRGSLPQKAQNHVIDSKNYAYKNSIINQTEKQLVDRILNLVHDLEVEYNDIFLIRMDENMHRESPKGEDLKLYQFEDNPENFYYQGFQPDFILLLMNEDYYIQIFIESKDESRYLTEKWKEDLLLYINEHEDSLVINTSINNIKIRGLKFYFYNDSQKTINQLIDMVIPE